ncbi:Protein NUCLEAR FUSION DEFECTIVE 4 [Linum perenne]
MGKIQDRLATFINNRWLVFVAAMWIQSWAGIGYLFGSISPVIKSSLGYNQRQLASLGVAKDLGDSVGFLTGNLCEILPLWGALLVGSFQNLIGYGWVWLIVTGRTPALPLWAMCILIFIGNNGETYFNTVALVSCVQNFPKSRGPVVGILKGFAGLSGAILTQIYTMIHSPDHASLIFMVAVGPAIIVISLMFFIRPVGGHRQNRPSDGMSFSFVYSVCILLAAYLMAVMLLEDLVPLNNTTIMTFTAVLSAAGAVRVKRRRGPHRGEDFTLGQALIKADFWLIFFSLLLGSGSGLTIIDNLGQLSDSLGYDNTHVFVSMISIWNFLGRVGGGYISEVVVR